MRLNYDVIIIGAGVVGNAIARELSRYQMKVAVTEKNLDVGLETSCRNSGVLHSGINYHPGTLRAKLAVRGNSMMDSLCRDLKVKIKRIGKLTVAFEESELPRLKHLKDQGESNGVPGLEILDNAAMLNIQPGIQCLYGLWSPSSAIISPYGLTIALAENAHDNGVDFYLNKSIASIRREDNGIGFVIKGSDRSEFFSRILINAAGHGSESIAQMVGITKGMNGESLKLWPCRGEYYVLDKRLNSSLNTLIYPANEEKNSGLGIHLTPTVDGNILIGPSSSYLPREDAEDYRVTEMVLKELRYEGQKLLKDMKVSDYIRSFSGNRPKLTPPEIGGNGDFIIENRKDLDGFINIVGIESPGLTSAPAIAEMTCDMVAQHLPLIEKKDFHAERKGFVERFCDLTTDEQEELIKGNSEYGEVFCRCEKITKKEVRDAIENSLGAKSLVSIKYRARSGMGRCQGSFCTTRIIKMLRDEYGYTPEDCVLREPGSNLFCGLVNETVSLR